jgi:hypothetical protein
MVTTQAPVAGDEGPPVRLPARWGAVAGLVAGGVALGAAELVAGALGRATSPAIVVGRAAIDRTPRWLKEYAIATFGERDKLVLVAGVLATIAVLAAVPGVLPSVTAAVLGAAALVVLVRPRLHRAGPAPLVPGQRGPAEHPADDGDAGTPRRPLLLAAAGAAAASTPRSRSRGSRPGTGGCACTAWSAASWS